MNSSKAFFSNRTEGLFQEFKIQLFKNSSLFAKRIVIVPSAAMKNWLNLQMASDRDLQIAMGCEMHFLGSSINYLESFFSSQNSMDLQNPTESELVFVLEAIIMEALDAFEAFDYATKEKWRPLFNYLKINEKISTRVQLSQNTIKQIIALCNQLAQLFTQYGLYAGKMIEEWSTQAPSLIWQKLLWDKIEERYAPWNYPYKRLEKKTIQNIGENDLHIHLFGLSYLAPLYHCYFENLAQYFPVNYYILSPCQHFWSDILSDKESSSLKHFWEQQNISEAQHTDLGALLSDRNPLLANFGRLGREMAQQIENNTVSVKENYIFPSTVVNHLEYSDFLSDDIEIHNENLFSELTILEAVQADIALLRNPKNNSKIAFDHYDQSIQVHAASKPMREVQIIYAIIMGIIDRHSSEEDPILPGDIMVMTPDLALYSPYIQTIFKSVDSQLDAHLMDVQTPSKNSSVQLFLNLVRLPLGRWEPSTLFLLFNSPIFQKRHQLKREDVHLFSRWIKEADIQWGVDVSHRQQILERNHGAREKITETSYGTWDEGLGRLLEGLIFEPSSNMLDGNQDLFYPLGGPDTSHEELLGKLIRLIRQLRIDLDPLTTGLQWTLIEWKNYLSYLIDTYIALEEEAEDICLLNQQLTILVQCSSKIETAKFTFESIRSHLERSFQQENINVFNMHLQAVHFCALLPMRAVPAKVIILMGMSEGIFPRQNQYSSMDLMQGSSKVDYKPSQVDFDRYLFLEALISARRYFINTYTSQEPGSSQRQQPSLLIDELMNYLDNAYTLPKGKLSQLCTFQHPFTPFHHAYFVQDSVLKSYSKANYTAALAHAQLLKHESKNFLDQFNLLEKNTLKENQETIKLKDLHAFIKNPLKVYCNKTLNIYIDQENDHDQMHNQTFIITPLNKSKLTKTETFSELPTLYTKAEHLGIVPNSPFKSGEIERVQEEIDLYRNNLKLLEIDISEIATIEFNERYEVASYVERAWKLPPLTICHPIYGNLKIVGEIEHVSKQGLLLLTADSFEEAIKAWPLILLFNLLIQQYQLPFSPQVFFIKSASCKSIDFFSSNEPNLSNPFDYLISYYIEYRHSLSPLIPEWIADILNGSYQSLTDKMKNIEDDDFKPIYNPYLKWLVRSSPTLNYISTIKNWQQTTLKLFMSMCKSWYPKMIEKTQHEEGHA